ncbi:LacI family DNA-binding transcriptional regulator, partial [Leifsonia sp. SIMBA_070]|uniref:LacI family DNA-binding transcriptional regulator n=1 Tax=Leifsonia sp. SIMBA_070 TaxID=3085810 RepID=UPI00397A6FC1
MRCAACLYCASTMARMRAEGDTMRRGTPNIGAVARAAGVSVGTVSNAINNPERLAAETLE